MTGRPLTFGEACARAGITRKTGYDWLHRSRAGLSTHEAARTLAGLVYRQGGRLYILEPDLQRWQATQRKLVRNYVPTDHEQLAAEARHLAERATEACCDLAADALRLAERALLEMRQ